MVQECSCVTKSQAQGVIEKVALPFYNPLEELSSRRLPKKEGLSYLQLNHLGRSPSPNPTHATSTVLYPPTEAQPPPPPPHAPPPGGPVWGGGRLGLSLGLRLSSCSSSAMRIRRWRAATWAASVASDATGGDLGEGERGWPLLGTAAVGRGAGGDDKRRC